MPPLCHAAIALLQAPLRAPSTLDIASIAAASALLCIAFAGLAVFFLTRRTQNRELTLIYFSVFSALYAVRLFAESPTVTSLFPAPSSFWFEIDWVITCTIIVALGLFLYQIAGEPLRTFFRWTLTIQTAFAVFGILGAVFGIEISRLRIVNNFVVLGTLLAAAIASVYQWLRNKGVPLSRDIRVFLFGFLFWLAFVVHANLLGLRVLRGRNVEFLGLLVFVACLGYIALQRTLAREEQLVSINKELEIARRIQSSTLPRTLPDLPHLEIDARYLPMSAVAGDFYDFLPAGPSAVGILIADVSGHGVPAAMIASMLKMAFASQSAHASDPARVLSELNRALCGKFEDHFVTAAYLFLDLEQGILRHSSAGHPPLLVLSAAGGITEISQGGLVLGLFPEAVYPSNEHTFSPGDRCLLYTDGLFEAKNAMDEEFGQNRCRELLSASHGRSAVSCADSLLAAVAAFSGPSRAQDDDITLLVVDFTD